MTRAVPPGAQHTLGLHPPAPFPDIHLSPGLGNQVLCRGYGWNMAISALEFCCSVQPSSADGNGRGHRNPAFLSLTPTLTETQLLLNRTLCKLPTFRFLISEESSLPIYASFSVVSLFHEAIWDCKDNCKLHSNFFLNSL